MSLSFKRLAAPLVVLLAGTFFCVPAHALGEPEFEQVFSLFAPQVIPSPELVKIFVEQYAEVEKEVSRRIRERVNAEVSKEGGPNSGSLGFVPQQEIVMTTIVTIANGGVMLGTTEGGGNPLASYRMYDQTSSMPFTKFLLGMASVDIKGLMTISAAVRHAMNGDVDMNTVVKNLAEDEIHQSITAELDKTLSEAQEALQWVMTKLPLLVLFMMYFLQTLSLAVGKLIGSKSARNVSHFKCFLRFLIFMTALLFFRPAAMWLIDAFNLLSLALASIAEQRLVMSMVVSSVFDIIKDNATALSMGALVMTIAGWVVQMSFLVMLVTRDILMGFSLVMGPTCIVLGYFQNMTSESNPLGNFFTGWCGNFVKLLLWGIIAAMMMLALGMYSVLSPFMTSSVVGMAVMALAFVYAAGSIPNYSERMSALVMTSVLMAVPNAVSPYVAQGTRNTLVHVGASVREWFVRRIRGSDTKTPTP